MTENRIALNLDLGMKERMKREKYGSRPV